MTRDLYRLYDTDGQLLYIGQSVDAERRANRHRQTKPWWGEVAHMQVEKVDSATALDAERDAIRTELPKYNVTHNPDYIAPPGAPRAGRPPIGDPIPVRFPPATLARIEQLAATDGVSRAEMIRRLVDRGMER